jgi:glutamate N-acetyltransferase/amino-acid N-acetyltransferase
VSVTAAAGFVAAGVACGIKQSGAADLALVATEDGRPVAAAATFTRNRATAAPVQVSRAHLVATGGRAAAVVLNSGNANAATGQDGRRVAEATCAAVAHGLGCRAEEVLICSTGLIGIPLPREPIERGVPALLAARRTDGGDEAARAIMTTDTHAKQTRQAGDGFVIGGMAKGAAMLAPDMATMLAVLTTDAALDAGALQDHLRDAVAATFNSLSVDGCTSTNDTVILLARPRPGAANTDLKQFAAALEQACGHLAEQMAGDAEGATKVVRVVVTGARTDDEGARAARAVAESQLVKCSLYGEDPYWGRVVSELGSAGVSFDPDRVTVAYNGVVACEQGVAAPTELGRLKEAMASRVIELAADLGLGTGRGAVLTNDLSHAYIDENMRTS